MLALDKALKEMQWLTVKELIGSAGKGMLSMFQIKEILVQSLAARQWDVVKALVLRKEAEKIIKAVLGQTILDASRKKQWELVCAILDLPTIKFCSFFSHCILEDALNNGQWKVVYHLLNGSDTEFLESWFWLESILYEAHRRNEWEVCFIILGMADSRLSSSSVHHILNFACEFREWKLVQAIVNLTGANKLSKGDLSELYINTLNRGFYLDLSRAVGQDMHELGHRLGLSGSQFESYYYPLAVCSSRLRFEQFKKLYPNSVPELHLIVIDEAKKRDSFARFASQKTKNCLTIACSITAHIFAVTLFKEGNQIHVIYTNRGRNAGELGAVGKRVLVYTLDNNEEGHLLLQQMGGVLATKCESFLSAFFNQEHVKVKINDELSAVFAKSPQKIGNCSIANTNMAWHFALANEFMKSNPCASLKDAYLATRGVYKKMRYEDRVSAFRALLKSSDSAARDEGVKQFVGKSFNKLTTLRPSYVVNSLVQTLTEDEISLLQHIPMSEEISVWGCFLSLVIESPTKPWDFFKKIISNFEISSWSLGYCISLFHEAIQAKVWDLVHLIMQINNSNKLPVENLKQGLVVAIRAGQVGLVSSLLTLNWDNETLMSCFDEAIKMQQWPIILSFLTMDRKNSLDKYTVVFAVQEAIRHKKWDVLEAISSLNEVNRPKAYLGHILKVAARAGEITLVSKLIMRRKELQLNTYKIQAALLEADRTGQFDVGLFLASFVIDRSSGWYSVVGHGFFTPRNEFLAITPQVRHPECNEGSRCVQVMV